MKHLHMALLLYISVQYSYSLPSHDQFESSTLDGGLLYSETSVPSSSVHCMRHIGILKPHPIGIILSEYLKFVYIETELAREQVQ